MPYPSYDYISELDPVTLAACEDFATQLVEYLTKEHKSDGAHGAITADSITAASSVFTTATIDTLTATTITAAAVIATSRVITLNLTVQADAVIAGSLAINTNKFTVDGSTGNTVVAGTLSAGATTLASAVITGALTVDTSTFAVDATNNRVGIGTASPAVQLHTTGAVRFAGITSGLLEVDPSGNVSANNSNLTAGSFTTVDLKTVSYNVFGLITAVS